jgi:ABC-type glycerol-3-phosphate transport system permease component
MANVQMTRRWSFNWGSAGTYLSFAVFTFIVLLPIYWMLRSALSLAPDLIKLPPIYFPNPTLKNFQTLMQQIPFFQYVRNSLAFAVSTTLVTLVVGFIAAYAFARIQFPGSGVILWMLLLTMALPDVGTIVPLYQILKNLHLINTINGITLVLSSTLTPFTVWVLISFIKQVPYEIEEAAILDGASLPQVFWHILLPVTTPGLVTMGLINFINAWNNLLYPLSFNTSPTSKTLSVAITEIYGGYSPYGKPWELIMTVGAVMTIPIVILIIFSQRAIVRGLVGGAIK